MPVVEPAVGLGSDKERNPVVAYLMCRRLLAVMPGGSPGQPVAEFVSVFVSVVQPVEWVARPMEPSGSAFVSGSGERPLDWNLFVPLEVLVAVAV